MFNVGFENFEVGEKAWLHPVLQLVSGVANTLFASGSMYCIAMRAPDFFFFNIGGAKSRPLD